MPLKSNGRSLAGRKRDRCGRFIHTSIDTDASSTAESEETSSTTSVSRSEVAVKTMFDLPGELRNSIYRYVLLQPDRIVLAGETRQQPPLLHVNRQIREEAASIYYSENLFYYEIKDMAGATMKPFRELLLRYRKHKVHNFRFKAKGHRNWSNLLDWLKGYHSDPDLYPCLKHARNASQPTTKIAVAAFEIVEKMHLLRWEELEKVLQSFHKAIVAENGAWAV